MKTLFGILLAVSVAASAEECLPKEYSPKVSAQLQQELSGKYAEFLRGLGEPCLYRLAQSDKTKEIYRFLWGGSLHNLETIIVRVEVAPDGTGTAYIKARKRSEGPVAGKMPKDEVKPLSIEEVAELRRVVEGFWAMPYSDDVIGFDGTQWELEAIESGKYHAVSRWSPAHRDKKFHRMGEYFLYKIAKVRIDHDYLN